MYLLRTNYTKKLIDAESYFDAMFSFDPDPATRQDFRTPEQIAIADSKPADKQAFVRSHRLNALMGSPGRSDTWTNEERSTYVTLSTEYGYSIYKGCDEGTIGLRYSKLLDDGETMMTQIVFLDPELWNQSVEGKYFDLELLLSKHFIINGETTQITEEDYANMIVSIKEDIADMKSGGATRCRLDFLNE